jgi:hypothetical protein
MLLSADYALKLEELNINHTKELSRLLEDQKTTLKQTVLEYEKKLQDEKQGKFL